MPILGSHMSIAGGYYKALERGAAVGCDCVQIFTKNNNQWRAKPLVPEDAARFRQAMDQTGIRHTLSHASYLINLASPKPDLRRKSIDALVVELERADFLGVPNVVVHPGSYTTSTIEEGITAIVGSLDEILKRTARLRSFLLLENTAGQGTNLGYDFAQLGEIIDRVPSPDRVGVCIDTCHAFAAGYPLGSRKEYLSTIREMDRQFGLKKIEAFHLNDSKRPLGSHKDRHEHIGKGEMGLEPFRHLVNDRRFRNVPMYLETEKGTVDGVDADERNLACLRSLIQSSPRRSSSSTV